MRHGQASLKLRLSGFISLFVASVVGAGVITAVTIGPNLAGISLLLLPLCCALPLSVGLFVALNSKWKIKGVFGVLLPPLVFPLLFGLLLSYMLFVERNPQHMFKVFVANPIPAGVTDIRARDISAGIDEDILIVFRASPVVVDAIIAQKQLVKAAEPRDGKFNFPNGYFPEYTWGPDWVFYERTFFDEEEHFTGYMMMWVDPRQSIVIYRKGG